MPALVLPARTRRLALAVALFGGLVPPVTAAEATPVQGWVSGPGLT